MAKEVAQRKMGPLVFPHQRDGNSEKILQEYPWTMRSPNF